MALDRRLLRDIAAKFVFAKADGLGQKIGRSRAERRELLLAEGKRELIGDARQKFLQRILRPRHVVAAKKPDHLLLIERQRPGVAHDKLGVGAAAARIAQYHELGLIP